MKSIETNTIVRNDFLKASTDPVDTRMPCKGKLWQEWSRIVFDKTSDFGCCWATIGCCRPEKMVSRCFVWYKPCGPWFCCSWCWWCCCWLYPFLPDCPEICVASFLDSCKRQIIIKSLEDRQWITGWNSSGSKQFGMQSSGFGKWPTIHQNRGAEQDAVSVFATEFLDENSILGAVRGKFPQ